MLKSFPRELLTIDVDLFSHATWDEDQGALVNLRGMQEIVSVIRLQFEKGWNLHSIESSDEEDSVFLLHFMKEKI